MERIKVALWRPPKFLFRVSYVVKTAADSMKGKGSLCPRQCGARMGVMLSIVNTCNGFCGGEGKKKFPSANCSDFWSCRWRLKNRIACISEESAHLGGKKVLFTQGKLQSRRVFSFSGNPSFCVCSCLSPFRTCMCRNFHLSICLVYF